MGWLNSKDVLKEAAGILGLTCVLDLPELGGESEEGRQYADQLLLCINSCVREVASEYVPLVAEEVVVSNGSVSFSDLKRPCFEVLSVKRDGVKRQFKVFPHEFTCPKGEVVVRYSYLPERVSGFDDVLEVGYRVSDRLIAYGVAANFCLMNGRLDDVDLFNFHYTAMIKNALIDNRDVVLPRRRFL